MQILPRPLRISPADRSARRTIVVLLGVLALVALAVGGAGLWTRLAEANRIEQGCWARNVSATIDSHRGRRGTVHVARVGFTDVQGAGHRGDVSVRNESYRGSPAVRYDPSNPESFVLSWNGQVVGRSGDDRFGPLAVFLLGVVFAGGLLGELLEHRRLVRLVRDGEDVLLRIESTGPARKTKENTLVAKYVVSYEAPRTGLPVKLEVEASPDESLFCGNQSNLRLVAVVDPSRPKKPVVLRRSDFFPLELTPGERAVALAALEDLAS